MQRVDDVAQRFRHLAAVRITHHGVEEDMTEGHLAQKRHSHHHHARHPEEEDVPPRLEQRVGVEGLEVCVPLVRPADGREGEETRGEPRVEHVLVLQHTQLLPREPSLGLCQSLFL